MRDIDLYNIGTDPESVQAALMELRRDFDAHNHDGANSRSFQTVIAETFSGRVFSIKKSSYTDTVAGLWEGLVGSIVKLNLGNATTYLKWDGSTIVIAGNATFTGTITIGTGNNIFKADANGIYLGHATFASAPFRVDMLGNAKVKSLERNDYHWFTTFESIDGYQKGGVWTEVIALEGGGNLGITTGAVTNDTAFIDKIALYNGGELTWNKDRKIKVGLRFLQEGSQTIRIGCGDLSSGTTRKVGFLLSNSTLYGMVADGTDYTVISYGVINTALTYILEAKFIAGTSVEFFVNETSIGTATTNIPTGATGSDFVFSAYLLTGENLAKKIFVGFCDFWQAN